jgi:hypothetical protein
LKRSGNQNGVAVSSSDKSEYEEPELSQEQSVLFTRLQRDALPIVQARHDAVKELGLVDVVLGLDKEMALKQPGGLEPASAEEWEGLLRRWAELMPNLDAWILEECKRVRVLVYGRKLPLTPTSDPMPIPSSFFFTHKLDVEKGTLRGEGWSFTDLRVVFVELLSPRHRELVENGLWIFGVWLANDAMETLRQRGGRPRKVDLVTAWLKELKAEGKLPKTAKAARARALIHFESQIESEDIHERTVYRAVDSFYSDEEQGTAGQN